MRQAAPLEELLDTKRRRLTRRLYCTFCEADWRLFGISLETISREIDRKLTIPTPVDSRTHEYTRSVIVGEYLEERIELFGKDECPVRTTAILTDYDAHLRDCPPLLGLIAIITRIANVGPEKDFQIRFCVELFSRRHVATTELAPHQDGVDVLFFLTLHNSMDGGEMRLYESKVNERQPGAVACDQVGTSLLRTISCEQGRGYCVNEVDQKGFRILHGCGPWRQPSSNLGDRRSLRLSLSRREALTSIG